MSNQPYQLTKIDISALRQADRVSFISNGSTFVRCIFDPDESHPYETERVIPAGNRIDDYRQDKTSPIKFCHDLIHTPNFDDEYKTFAAIVRAEDELTLIWTVDGGNDYEKDAGLHHDMLSVRINRADKRFTFRLCESVTPNNSARMCKTSLWG